jgi:uncharacterized phage-associated protein
MTISVFDAAKYLCKKSGWSLTNLELQKIIYIAHMFHLGEQSMPLIKEHFEAWDYGPVQPDLYHHIKVYGASPIKSLFHLGRDIPKDGSEARILDKVFSQLFNKSPSWLVAVTHWEDGAWAKHYGSGAFSEIIPDTDIQQEYLDREQNAARREKVPQQSN